MEMNRRSFPKGLAGNVARETLGTKKKYALPTPRQTKTNHRNMEISRNNQTKTGLEYPKLPLLEIKSKLKISLDLIKYLDL